MDGLKREASALRAFAGFGAVRVLSENSGLLLLECATPGSSLKNFFPENDNAAINITAHVIERLHQTPIRYQAVKHFHISKIGTYQKIIFKKPERCAVNCYKLPQTPYCCMEICIMIIFCKMGMIGW